MKKKKFTGWSLAVVILLLLVPACSSGTGDEEETSSNTGEAQVAQNITTKSEEDMKFQLIELPYAPNALEPVISQQTIELHHGKHLQGYVNNLNKLIEGTKFADMDLVSIVKESDGGIFNNAGQNLNHIYYFLQFSPNGGGKPTGNLAKAIDEQYGSFEEFQKEFEEASTTLFGAGWSWLATDKEGKLHITKEQNAGNPVTKDLIPLLTVDVWEHGYYLDYQNRRADHVKELWKIIDWSVVGERYDNRDKEIKL